MRALGELQFDLGEGPSPESWASGRPVLVADLAATAARWVAFTPAAGAAGVGGVYAFPLGLGAVRLGVLTCYAGAGTTLGQPQLRHCLTAAETATEILLAAVDHGRPLFAHPEARAELSIRTEVYQAQGMLMARLDISLEEALARLRAMAYAEDVSLNQLATELVDGRRPFPGPDPSDP